MIGQVEIRREAAGDVTFFVPLDSKGARLVVPDDVIKVEYTRELGFRFVGKTYGVMLRVPDRIVLVPEILFEHGHSAFKFRQESSRNLDGVLRRRDGPRRMLLLNQNELATITLGNLNSDFSACADTESTNFIRTFFGVLRGHKQTLLLEPNPDPARLKRTGWGRSASYL